MLNAGDVRIESRPMDHARGMWAGMRPCWWTATHEATGFSVTWHEHCDGRSFQNKQRDTALACLDLMIEEMGPLTLPLVLDEPRTQQEATD